MVNDELLKEEERVFNVLLSGCETLSIDFFSREVHNFGDIIIVDSRDDFKINEGHLSCRPHFVIQGITIMPQNDEQLTQICGLLDRIKKEEQQKLIEDRIKTLRSIV